MKWYIKVLKNYAEFSGRARRKEYWMFTLINIIVIVAILLLTGSLSNLGQTSSNPSMGMGVILYFIYLLAVFIPSLAVTARRLHDTNRSGWWMLISFVPLIGGIVLLVFLVLDSDTGENYYGPTPKQQAPAR